MTDTQLAKVNRALISVSDKSGILPFATALRDLGVELLSTGGTFRLLKENGLAVTEVAELIPWLIEVVAFSQSSEWLPGPSIFT